MGDVSSIVRSHPSGASGLTLIMITKFRKSALLACAFVLLLWAIELIERSTGADLYRLGVYPLQAAGLPGILFAPLLHGSWYHLLSNSFGVLFF